MSSSLNSKCYQLRYQILPFGSLKKGKATKGLSDGGDIPEPKLDVPWYVEPDASLIRDTETL